MMSVVENESVVPAANVRTTPGAIVRSPPTALLPESVRVVHSVP